MSKEAEKELKELYLIGPRITMDPETKNMLEGRNDCLIIGDGENLIDPEQLKQILQDKNLKIGPNTRIDIDGHGLREKDGQHSITLFKNIKSTTNVFKTLKNLAEPNHPLYVHLWSCYGGSANKSVEDLGKESILVTHIEAKESASTSLINYFNNASLTRYLNLNITPHQRFVLDIQENFEAATFNQVTKEGNHRTFKFTRIPKETSKKESSQEIFMADVLKQIDDHETIHDFVKEGERFKKNFPDDDVQAAIKDISNISEDVAKKFAQGVLVHTFMVESQTTLASTRNLLDRLQSKGIDINGSPDNNMNALHWAAYNNSIDKINLLLEEKYKTNGTTQAVNSQTALHLAANNGQLNIAEIPIDKNPDVITIQDNKGQTALHCSAQEGCTTVVEILIGQNQNIITIQDNSGQTALHLAANNNHISILETLLECNPNNTSNFTTLHWATQEGNINLVKELINKDSSTIITQDDDKLTALDLAAQAGHTDVVTIIEKLQIEQAVKNINTELKKIEPYY